MSSDSYHHGNLRTALLEAAAGIIGETGLEGLTLREVARRAGVSHAAPKHHFADKAQLVRELVIESFADFAAVLRRADRGTSGDERLRNLGNAYVRWAFANPDRFRLLFRPELRGGDEDGAIASAADDAYQLVLDAVSAGQKDRTVIAGDPADVALAAWSAAHGVATLLIDGPFRTRGGSMAAARRAIDRLLDGFRRKK